MSIGDEIRRIYVRSGRSFNDIARAMHYRRASSLQRYLESAYDKELKVSWIKRFAGAVHGYGTPPLDKKEVEARLGSVNRRQVFPQGDRLSTSNARASESEGGDDYQMHWEIYDLAVDLLARLSPAQRRQAVIDAIERAEPPPSKGTASSP